jgi:hypothetical protein
VSQCVRDAVSKERLRIHHDNRRPVCHCTDLRTTSPSQAKLSDRQSRRRMGPIQQERQQQICDMRRVRFEAAADLRERPSAGNRQPEEIGRRRLVQTSRSRREPPAVATSASPLTTTGRASPARYQKFRLIIRRWQAVVRLSSEVQADQRASRASGQWRVWTSR